MELAPLAPTVSARRTGCARRARRVGGTPLLAAVLVAMTVAAGACSTGASSAAGGTAPSAATQVPGGPCPAAPVRVVVSVDPWADIVRQLGGQCATVTTVLAAGAGDPHDFEPSVGD